MAERPYTLLNCCLSLDGYLDDASADRLVLSNDADLDRVDALRADCDAILVGATTIRNDNPRLQVRSQARVRARAAAGRPPGPLKVTLTGLAKLDPGASFFASGSEEKLVYCCTETLDAARATLGPVATVLDAGTPVRVGAIAEDLHRRGVRRLLVEGGARVLSQFLLEGVADELQVAVAPFLVGDSAGRRFLDDGAYPWTARRRARLLGTRVLGDVVLLRYGLSDRCSA
jgi:5-amino-6-(5-phosphoribosylamino)uracil reductase